jgi:hypothetical protein
MGLLHELIKIEREEYQMTWRPRSDEPTDFSVKVPGLNE